MATRETRTSTSQWRTRSRTAPPSARRDRTASPSFLAPHATRSSASAALESGQNRTQKIPRTPSSSAAGLEARVRAGKAGREARPRRSALGRADGWRSGAGHSGLAAESASVPGRFACRIIWSLLDCLPWVAVYVFSVQCASRMADHMYDGTERIREGRFRLRNQTHIARVAMVLTCSVAKEYRSNTA